LFYLYINYLLANLYKKGEYRGFLDIIFENCLKDLNIFFNL